MVREVIRDKNGDVIAATCVDEPMSDKARAALADVVQVALRLQQERDPDGIAGDRQRRALDRLYKRQTPYCAAEGCFRVDGHDGRHLPADYLKKA